MVATTIVLGCGGCTLVKPVVGAVTGPMIMLGNGTCDFGGSCGSCGCDILCTLGVLSVFGAAGGLVTGIISDVRVLTRDAEVPTDNWWDPFAINY